MLGYVPLHTPNLIDPPNPTRKTYAQSFMEQHALHLCADAGPASGGPPWLLLTRIMAVSVGSAKRCVLLYTSATREGPTGR